MTTSYPLDAALDAEIDAILTAPHGTAPVGEDKRHLAQELNCIERCEKAMACDGDPVATINRLLDATIASIGDTPANAETLAGLMAVREFHLPGLPDAFEVDTSRAYRKGACV